MSYLAKGVIGNIFSPSQRYLSKGKRLAKSAKGTKQSRKLPFSSSESDVRKRILGQGSSTVKELVARKKAFEQRLSPYY